MSVGYNGSTAHSAVSYEESVNSKILLVIFTVLCKPRDRQEWRAHPTSLQSVLSAPFLEIQRKGRQRKTRKRLIGRF